MPLPLAPKHRPNRVLLGLVLVVCALIVVACGSSSPSSTTSASVGAASKTAAGGSSAGSATTGSTGTGSSSGGTSSTGATGSSQSPRRHVKRATKGTGAAGTAPRRRVKSSALRRCLEQNGIKPHVSGSKGSTPNELQEALKHCDPQLARRPGPRPAAGLRRKLLARPGYRQALARFTSCMRKNGVPNFPEANTTGNGPLFPSGTIKPTPQLRAAQRACIGQLRVH